MLQQRGLVVAEPAVAESFLAHVNYYRFSGYCLAFESPGQRHVFAPGTTFEHVKAAYDFDFALRDLLCEALEIVEIDLRTATAHHFGRKYGAFGHTDAANFYQPPAPLHPNPATPRIGFRHGDWLGRLKSEAKRSKELFVTHFQSSYLEWPNLPLWVATEVMSFGALSVMIEEMQKAEQKAISARYGVQPDVLVNWGHHLSVVRNLCAHHCRLWDRFWSVRPKLPPNKKGWQPPHLAGNSRLSATLLILYQLLKRCLPTPDPYPADWRKRVNTYLGNLPATPNAAEKLGLTPDWFVGPLWQ